MPESARLPRILLPGTDLSVSSIGYGAAGFGTEATGERAAALFDRFLAAGGNFFDTAHCYACWVPGGVGASEKTLGKLLQGVSRESFVVATKGGHPDFPPEYHRPDAYLSHEVVSKDLEESLDRLGLPWVDLYYLHRDDPRVPAGEIIEMMNGFIDDGRVRWIGASNWPLSRMEAANAHAGRRGLQRFVALQNQWSLAVPTWTPGGDPTVRFLSSADTGWLREQQVAAIAYSSTANGFFATGGRRGDSFHGETNRRRLERAEALATEIGATPNQVALAYLMAQPCTVIPLVGTCDPAHLDDALGAATVRLSPVQVEWLEN